MAELTAAVGNSAINKIVLAAGTYELGSTMCGNRLYTDTQSAICIDRALTIQADVPGAVVLNGMGNRRSVFQIKSGLSRAIVNLIGLNITGGRSDGGGVSIRSGVANFEGCNIHENQASGEDENGDIGLGGGGVYVDSDGVANFESCNIHDNSVGSGGYYGGGGLLIFGTATLTNTNVYSNEVPESSDDGGGGVVVVSGGVANFKGCDIHDNTAGVCSPSPLPSHFRHHPLELTLEPTGCGVGASGFRVVMPIITVVASLSMEWQNLRAARSITTPLMGCVAC